MPRKQTPSPVSPRAPLVWLAASALLLFAIGEVYRFTRSESGQLALARHLGIGDPARITRIVGKRLRLALERAGVPADSVRESVVEGRQARVLWRVGIRSGASLLQLNYIVTRTLESQGALVLSGQETWTEKGAPMLRLTVGLPRRATHELLAVRMAPAGGAGAEEPTARLTIVLFGFGDSPAAADSFFRLPVPFAVALPPALKTSREIFRAAHARGREVVLHLPLEPINYPQVNPGPGILLVTMKPSRISSEVRRYLDQAEPVTAVANHMGSLATQDMTLMRAVYHELRRSEVPFLHVVPAAGAVCKPLAAEMGVRYAEPGVVLDYEARLGDARALEKGWKEALRRARSGGQLIVWMRATPLAGRWLPGALTSKRLGGVSIVPLAALIRTPASL